MPSDKKNEPVNPEGREPQQDGLTPFLARFEEAAGAYAGSIAAALQGGSSADIGQVLGETLRTQARELAGLVRTELGRTSPRTRAEVERVLQIQAGVLLADGAARVAGDTGTAERVFALSGIFMEIKKIIRTILEIIFPRLPPWLEKVFGLLDEILRLLGSLLHPTISRAMSEAEVSHLRELYEMRRLQFLEEGHGTGEEIEES